jgi:hypothetical protein
MSEQPTDTTREDLHVVAELLLAGPQHRASGTIRLRPLPGGFGTVSEPDLRVQDGELVVGAGTGEERRRPLDGAGLAELAELAGVEPAAPEGVYTDTTGGDPDRPLRVDAARAGRIADWYATGDRAMRRLAPDTVPVLWPEHFDLGITLDQVNYGVSPGDGYSAEPYAYVGPWTPLSGEFWNAPFGAARPIGDLPDEDALLAFFAQARDLAGQPG